MTSVASVPANYRRRLVQSDQVEADELVARHDLPPSGSISGRKLVVTFAGAFEFQVGRDRTWVDSGRILFAFDGEDYVDHHIVDGVGHASVILSPRTDLLDELWGSEGAARVRRGSLGAQVLAQRLRRAAEPLEAHEIALDLIHECSAGRQTIARLDQRCVRLAKSALHDCPDGRITLDKLATEMGVTPVHLSQCFKQSEGMPLYRYQTELRLARALARLPHCTDITDLALDLGFSSHSHFTAVFRARIGMTPSQFRGLTRQ